MAWMKNLLIFVLLIMVFAAYCPETYEATKISIKNWFERNFYKGQKDQLPLSNLTNITMNVSSNISMEDV